MTNKESISVMDRPNGNASACSSEWTPIGTTFGAAQFLEFTFLVRKNMARVGDIVSLRMHIGCTMTTT